MIFMANEPDTLAVWALARCIRLARRCCSYLGAPGKGGSVLGHRDSLTGWAEGWHQPWGGGTLAFCISIPSSAVGQRGAQGERAAACRGLLEFFKMQNSLGCYSYQENSFRCCIVLRRVLRQLNSTFRFSVWY